MKNFNPGRDTCGWVARRLAPAAFFSLLVLVLPLTARADNVTLFSGTTSVQAPPGQISIALIGTGGAFSLNYFNSEYAGPLVTSFGFQSITQGFGSVSFNSVTSQFFTGSLSFNNSLLTGQVTAFHTLDDAVNNNALFTVFFAGGGFQMTGETSRTFTVATPEPASLVLLATGLGAVLAGRRRQRKQSS